MMEMNGDSDSFDAAHSVTIIVLDIIQTVTNSAVDIAATIKHEGL